jgi:hypothetical protein
MQEFEKNSGACPEFESHVMFYAMDELEGAERDALEEHLDHCARCVAALDGERKFLEMATSDRRLEPTPALLANCRNRFEDTLDEMDHRSIWVRWRESLFPAHWLALHPAASAAMLLVIGFSAGILGPWHKQQAQNLPTQPTTAATLASMGLNSQELQSANVSGINLVPSSNNSQPPQLVIQLNTERPIVLQGTADDDNMKRVLLYVLHNNQRFCPDVRINAVEALKARAEDPDVERALSHAVLTDRNAAVRLKALDALTAAKPDTSSMQTMVDALRKDTNIGVRVEAVDALLVASQHGGLTADPDAVSVLREHARTDTNTYIRLQSAAAIQQLQPNQQ